jgi:hypothetical protein
MCYIYLADIYCDGCGEEIKREIATDILDGNGYKYLADILDQEGWSDMSETERIDACVDQLDWMDQNDYDSCEYPKYCNDSGASDTPQHCGCGEDCVGRIKLGDDDYCGDLIDGGLTADGIEYVRKAVREGGRCSALWRDEFDWIDFDDDEYCIDCSYNGDDAEIDSDGRCAVCAFENMFKDGNDDNG